MSKMKTHSGAKKRFKISSTGKIIRQQAGKSHLMRHKLRKQSRQLRKNTLLCPGYKNMIMKLLG